MTTPDTDITIIGAGAAGLMAAIWAGRTNPDRSILVLDGARSLGAKILVAGGGRCNVTHDVIDDTAYAGSSRNAIRKVLKQFNVEKTITFFSELGVELKREETGKLFPVTDRARSVLDALLNATRDAGVEIQFPRRVKKITNENDLFTVSGEWGELTTRKLILATGGKSLPKTGSDGAGYTFAKSLGHTITERIFPALVPLIVSEKCFIRSLSGLTLPVSVSVRSGTGKKIAELEGSMLCTHFGISGPAALDISRFLTEAQFDDSDAHLLLNWLPGETLQSLDTELTSLNSSIEIITYLRNKLPDRLAQAICKDSKVDIHTRAASLTRDSRKAIARTLTEMRVPVTGDRGYKHAEVTAGGVPLNELHLNKMESRTTPGLFIVGEVCDVDGRIGGYNFQWAWSSGYVAGVSV